MRHVKLDRKVVDDVLGGEDAWRHMPKTQASCDRCPSTEAWVQEIQIRAADEPATLFFRCCQCGFQWSVGRAAMPAHRPAYILSYATTVLIIFFYFVPNINYAGARDDAWTRSGGA